MKKITLILLLLIGFSGVESANAQVQNYLPAEVQRVPQQKIVNAFKESTQISDQDLPVYAKTIWTIAWFGRLESKDGVIKITYVPGEWNNGHFYNGTAWVQGNRNTNYPAESKILNALSDLQQRVEDILGKSVPPLNGEYPDKYVERILNYLPLSGLITTGTSGKY